MENTLPKSHSSDSVDNKSEVQNKKSAKNQSAAKSNIEPYLKLDIRVAKIIEIEAHPTSDNLYVSKIETAPGKTRVINL